MTTLVTGSNGFLGVALVRRLLERGSRDLCLLARAGSDRRRLDEVLAAHAEQPVELRTGSLSSVDAAEQAVRGADVILHLAAGLSGAAADIFLSTVVTSKNLLAALERTGARPKIVLVSSFGVYGVAEQGRGYLVTEETPLEAHPERRDSYSQAKLRQERLFREVCGRLGIPLVVLRPGVIYGPGGSAFSARVGLSFPGLFLFLGGDNLLPLTYVDSCAEAIALTASDPRALGGTFNVVDDDLPTCREYLRLYAKNVRPIRAVPIPYPALEALSAWVERYHRWSKGQLPAVFTPYKTRTSWGGNRFDNSTLKALGWRPVVPTDEGLRRTFADLRRHAAAST